MEFVPAELRHLSVLIGQSESSESPGSIPRKHCTTCELNPKKPKSNISVDIQVEKLCLELHPDSF